MRNAASLDGCRKREFFDGLNRIKSMSLPSLVQVQSTLSLLRFEFNAGLSSLGEAQIAEVLCYFSESNFISKYPIDTIVLSPLLRAKETGKYLFQDSSIVSIELESLREVTSLEYMNTVTLNSRINEFEEWIRNSPYNTIFVITHSYFLKKLLHIPETVHNCDIWSAIFSPNDSLGDSNNINSSFSSTTSSSSSWRNIELIFRVNQLSRSPTLTTNSSGSAVNNNSVLDESNEIFCRICQMTRAETPDMEMIRPCLCSGSQAYIHVLCLNQWRVTSTDAQECCSVCRFRYLVQRRVEAEWLLYPWTSVVLSLIIQLLITFLVGYLIYFITNVSKFDSFGAIFYWLPKEMYDELRELQTVVSRNVGVSRIGYTCSSYLHFRHTSVGFLLQRFYLSHQATKRVMAFLCGDIVLTVLEIIRMGITFISILSGFLYFWSHADMFGRPPMGIYGGIPLVSSYVSANYSLGMIPGCVVFAKQLYMTVKELTRDIAHRIGEHIIEPSSVQNTTSTTTTTSSVSYIELQQQIQLPEEVIFEDH